MTSPRRTVPLLLLLALPAAAGAEEGLRSRAHPDLAARLAAIRTVGIATPELKVYELTASNTPVYRTDWSDQGREAVTVGLEDLLRNRGLTVKRFAAAAPEVEGEMREVQLLYEAVVGAVLQATYANKFPVKMARFEYTLGDMGKILESQGVDALVFTIGTGAVSSAGRAAIQVVGALFAGVSSSGVDRLLVGVVDRSGDLIWFGIYASSGSDLRDPASATEFVRKLAAELPPPAPR